MEEKRELNEENTNEQEPLESATIPKPQDSFTKVTGMYKDWFF